MNVLVEKLRAIGCNSTLLPPEERVLIIIAAGEIEQLELRLESCAVLAKIAAQSLELAGKKR